MSSPDNEEKTVTTLQPSNPQPPLQDGGTRAWLQVLGSFLVFTNIWGLTFAFGAFQSYYELTYIPHESASAISWISTVSTFLLIVVGILSGPLFDLGYFRSMLLVGAIMETLGVFLTSISTTYWQLMLSQGILTGLGNGLLYLPGLVLVGRAFKRHRAVAMSITTCGAPTGGVIYTLAFEQFIQRMSFGWTVRTMGFIMLGTYCLAFPLILWGASNMGNLASGTPRKIFDRTALRNLPFWSYTTSILLISSGYVTPFIFIPSYGQSVLGLSRSISLYTSMIMQATSIIGRLIAGYTASKIGVLIPWISCVVSSGVLCLAWIGATNTASFIAVAALYGCVSGALIPLPPSVFPVVCPDASVFGARLGMAQAINSIGSLVGPPIAAALVQVTSNGGRINYLAMQLFSGGVLMLGSFDLVCLWILLIRRRGEGSKLI